ncbi:Uridine kinase like [Carpediemonas membranifera]|uniref:uridine/cytidine kinase n=1 Tax=Carpediemonas membranifera TaxID=201153 RepID=A0A8J6AXE5_9EUKA|nr:Uridine kinase like [Carpediemonas membranifera]|eukprot:KAG9394865.1 Uridine kinase like [Carpediemonas membranifera]
MNSDLLQKFRGGHISRHAGPLIIGVAGGSASGKTSCCKAIEGMMPNRTATVIALDSFYHDLTEEQRHNPEACNFDHPEMFDFNALIEVVQGLRRGEAVQVPVYDYVTSSRVDYTTVQPVDIVLVEGIFVLLHDELRKLFDLKIFVDTDADERLARRIERDITERGRTILSVLTQYRLTVKPAHDDFIQPSMRNADVSVPRGVDNKSAMQMLVSHIQFHGMVERQQYYTVCSAVTPFKTQAAPASLNAFSRISAQRLHLHNGVDDGYQYADSS